MANRSASLYLYLHTKVGWRYCPAVFRGKKIDPHRLSLYIPAQGKFVVGYDSQACYYLGYRQDGKKVWERLTSDPHAAQQALERKRGELMTEAAGGTVVRDAVEARRDLKVSIKEWLDLVKEGLGKSSLDAKTLVMEEFIDSCERRLKYVEDITRLDCLHYLGSYLIDQGNGNRTRYNKFVHLKDFLTEYGCNIFKKGDKPKYENSPVEVYSDPEVAKFFEACQNCDYLHLMFSVYYAAGLRFREMLSLRWQDIDLIERYIHVRPRTEYGFVPKSWHCRPIPLTQELADRLKAYKGQSAQALVFPTSNGKPDYHHLDWCKQIAEKAGMDPEECYLHKWRASFCTTLLREGWDLGSVMKVMGHKNLSSTARYVAYLENAALLKKMDLTKVFHLRSMGTLPPVRPKGKDEQNA